MMSRLGYVLWLALLFSTTVRAQQVTGALEDIDRLREEGRYVEALEALEALAAEAPDNAEVLWRRSRTRVDIGEGAGDEDVQKTHYRAALSDADAAVAADTQNVEAHLARAIAAGRLALISGIRERIELSRDLKESIDRAIALDPHNGAAYHVRARWHYEGASLGLLERTIVKAVYGGLPEASYEQAVKDFQRAIAIDSSILVNYLELGKTYLKLGRQDEAQQVLARVLALPTQHPDDPEHKQEAHRLLRRL